MLSAGAYAAIFVAYEAVEQAAYTGSSLTPNPTSTVQKCPPVPTSGEFTPTVTPTSTPTRTSVRGPGQRRCSKTAAIRNELHKIGTETAFETVFGPIRFDGAGQNKHTALITRVQFGGFEIIYPPEHKTRN